jgi:hypothetical protein
MEAELIDTNAVDTNAVDTNAVDAAVKTPKKRGRKPKGGKIVPNNISSDLNIIPEPNIILHLKCGDGDLTNPNMTKQLPIETFQFDTGELGYSDIINQTNVILNMNDDVPAADDKKKSDEPDETNQLWAKLKELTYMLHNNNISDKKSACFWCTCSFDNPAILIPKFELNNMYHCYGCFCSPECATAYIFEEHIDTSTKFERYHLLNHIYCKIYDYKKNIKPAPNPYYTLSKYYGNLSIQEYRILLKNERLLLIVDKPLSRILPELHEDNDDYMFNSDTISTSNKFKLRRKTKKSKTDILSNNFNLK